ncbi:MAG: efflux transporter outer membrane subunit [Gammaproteobacteria bacterium]|nr:efflux transporter outer membrane subunit [Gammaproteobacteria bacterium]
MKVSKSISRIFFYTLVVLCAGIISGCAVGTDYKRPEIPDINTYTVNPVPSRTEAYPVTLGGSQHFVRSKVDPSWWKVFGSSRLDSLVERALLSSLTLEAARAKLEQAEQTYQAQGGATQYPQVTADAGGSRQRVNTAAFGQSAGSKTFGLINAGVNVSYSLDLFGGNRRMLESFAAEADYQRYQLETARLLLIANVITTAITQAQLAAQIQASEQILSAQEEQLNITKKRLSLGASSQNEVFSLQATVEQSRVNISQLRNSFEQSHHLMAVFVGITPGDSDIPSFVLDDFTLPAQLPVVIPSELVRQRPDIQASEALLQAANARYGTAIAKRYPQINLSADIGSQALTASTLFGAGTMVWGVAGQLVQPLFHKGLVAESRAARAGFDEAEANYRQTVFHALQNVADVLRALEYDASALAAQASANNAAQGILQLVRQEYNIGAANHLEVLAAEQQVQLNALNLVTTQSRRLIDTVALYQAMGGGVLITSKGSVHLKDQ